MASQSDFILPYATWDYIRIIRDYYENTPTWIIALSIGKSENFVYRTAYSLGLRKSNDYIDALKQDATSKVLELGKPYRFVKGQQPMNKGKKMSCDVYERVKHTMFKKGHKPHNTNYDGHISVRRDKTGRNYTYIRVSEGKYSLLHRVVWEKNNGPIPNGFIVAFKNGDTMDCNIGNLELITREQNMLRNSMLTKYPSDVVQVIRLNGALKRRIRNLEKRW